MLSLIQQVSHNQKRKIVFLSLLVLISNLLEGAGISLIIPVFQKLLGQSSLDNPFNASISLFLMKMGVTPSLVNILILLNVAFICKTLMSVLAKFYSTRIAAEYLKHIQKDLFKLLLDARISLFYN
jgi:ABC-type multidrug transport system fused ATPase/permease subunit